VPVSVTRMHQTVAGKMVFGQVKEARRPVEHASKPRQENVSMKSKFRARLASPLKRRSAPDL
jgi:hypothetical protein